MTTHALSMFATMCYAPDKEKALPVQEDGRELDLQSREVTRAMSMRHRTQCLKILFDDLFGE